MGKKPAQTQKSDKNQNAHMPSSTPAMSQTIMPDNYEEGWYQDEYGNWLNQFDWKQVRYFFGGPNIGHFDFQLNSNYKCMYCIDYFCLVI